VTWLSRGGIVIGGRLLLDPTWPEFPLCSIIAAVTVRVCTDPWHGVRGAARLAVMQLKRAAEQISIAS
jgi:hypothetical protein